MIFEHLGIKDAFLIKPKIFEDHRGSFRRSFCENEFKKNGIDFGVLQGNISENPRLGTLRGFHYQLEPFQEAKVITCLKGEIFDVIIDLRNNSPTFLKTISITIDSKSKNSLFIPKGCANAWLTTQENSIIHYYMSDFYKPGYDRGIRYNDSFFNIQWPFEPKIISEKDQCYSDFKENEYL